MPAVNPDSNSEPVDTLFYDGQCPLCANEIAELKRSRGDALNIVDIHSLSADSGPDQDTLLRTLHLQRADGQWLRGADANVAAWEGTSKAGLLRILRGPLIRYAVDMAYALWARWRYRRLYGSGFNAEHDAPESH
ncbi:MAG: putative DCC family thiol-disulfide oxidoreductase YuxK [Halieaceae bacterium]